MGMSVFPDNKFLISLGLILVLAAGGYTFWYIHNQELVSHSIQEQQEVEHLVTEFGLRLNRVSLAASEDLVTQQLRDAYSDLVTPELLSYWTEYPSSAPGRLTSSPWPDHIDITQIEKVRQGLYHVGGDVILMTSSEVANGGNAGIEHVSISVIREQDTWLISKYTIIQ